MHIVKYRDCAVSCSAKTAEPIEMQFGMLRLVGPERTCIRRTWERRCSHWNRHFWIDWPIEKHCKA